MRVATALTTLALSGAVNAGFITGTVDFSGDMTVTGDLNGNATVSFENVENTAAGRTGSYAATFQDPNINGDFFRDITVVGGVVQTPIAPLWDFYDGGANGGEYASFDLETIVVHSVIDFDLDGNVDFWNLAGTGTLTMDGFDDTDGTFFLSSQNNLLSFSSSNEATGQPGPNVNVSEPGSMALIALGLIALWGARRQARG